MFRRKDHERGASAVEFALIALFVMLPLLAFTIQSATLFWGYQAASSAAREAARFGAVQPCNNADIEARGDERVDEVAPADGSAGFTTVTSGVPTVVGDELTVEVAIDSYQLINIPSWPDQIVKTATTRIENIPAGGC
jgi:Flp pilus assembly protein TadG